MFSMVSIKSIILRITDFIFFVVLLPLMPVLKFTSRFQGQLPNCQSLLDWSRIGIMRHHFYNPLYLPSSINVSQPDNRFIVGLDLNEKTQIEILGNFLFADELLEIYQNKKFYNFDFCNGAFESGDAEYLYNIVRFFKPNRIIEIGAGHSSTIAHIALSKNFDENMHKFHHTCIDPYPHPVIKALPIEIIAEKVEDCSLDLFSILDRNDILFIDSSHVIRPQGDVLFEYLCILGSLKPGVLIHVHDVFTPRDYRPDWLVKDRRHWNEQYLLEAFLSFNEHFEVIGAVNWLWHKYPDKMKQACPVLCEYISNEPGSFWFRRIK